MTPMLPILFALAAHAQSCGCSRGISLPTGSIVRPWEGAFTAGYRMAQSGGKGWDGLSAVDRAGDGMSDMAMPGHLVQSTSLDASIGLPKGFAVEAAGDYLFVHPLGASGMAGDGDDSYFADTSVLARYGARLRDGYVGVGVGATLPTGPVRTMRVGKGTVGGVVVAQASYAVTPLLALSAAIGGQPTLFALSNGYRVGSSYDAILAAHVSPRENSRLVLEGCLIGTDLLEDTWNGVHYANTGLLSADVGLGATYDVWSHDLRGATLGVRVQAPIAQVDGDPYLAENWAVTSTITVVAF